MLVAGRIECELGDRSLCNLVLVSMKRNLVDRGSATFRLQVARIQGRWRDCPRLLYSKFRYVVLDCSDV